MASSLVWINSSNDGIPTLNAEDLSRVRSQACRDARKREREQAIQALRRPSTGVRNGVAPSRIVLPRHARSPKSPYGQTAEPQGSETNVADESESDSASSIQRWDSDVSGDFYPAIGAPTPSISVIPPPVQSLAATQQALAAAFIEGHLSKAAYRSFAALGQYVGPVIRRSRSWPAANNALGLLQLNSKTDSPHPSLAEEGQRQYGRMLAFLQDELGSSSVDLAGVTGTVFHLLLCETYSAIPENATSRQKHLDGMAALIDRMDPLSSSAPLDAFMIKSGRMLLLTNALLTRDPGPLRSVTLHSVQQDCRESALEQLLQHAMRVPSLLHAVDNIRNKSPSGLHSLLPAIQKVHALELDFETWLAHKALSSTFDLELSESSDVARLSYVQPSLDRLKQVFGHAPAFPSFGIANMQVLYWACLLLLRMSMLDLVNMATLHADHAALTAVKDRDLEAESFACAALLCRSTPFLLQEAGGNVSQAASIRGPIYFAQMCFESLGSKAELDCVHTTEAEMRAHFHSLNWDALLPWSFLALIWQTAG